MRTLKKTLCLVLCIAMMAGLCMISTSAAFTDADEIVYKEAVDVLAGLGVLNGIEQADGTFKFDPKGTLTREQAAKIIAYILAMDDIKAEAPFTDCKGRWSEAPIAVCAAEGIVNGVTADTFNPTGILTGNMFAKMLLGALGYDAVENGMTGTSWEIGVAKLLKTTGLADNIKNYDGTANMTREEACQMAFDALFMSVSGKAVYTVEGINGETFDDFISAFAAAGGDASKVEKDIPEDTLAKKNFAGLEATNTPDESGRPARQWMYDDDGKATTPDLKLYEIVYTPAYTITATKDYEIANVAAANAAINEQLKITTDSKKLDATGAAVCYNGVADQLAGKIEKGNIVEIYMANGSKTKIATVVVTEYFLVKITKVADLTAREQKAIAAAVKAGTYAADSAEALATKNVTAYADGRSYTIYDTQFADFDYEVGDYVLVAFNFAKGTVIASKAAEIVSGTVSATKGGQFCINGTYYTNASGENVARGVEYTFALNAAGELAALVEAPAVEATDYALVYAIGMTAGKGGLNSDGVYVAGDVTYTAYAVLADGTKASYPIETATDKNENVIPAGYDKLVLLEAGKAVEEQYENGLLVDFEPGVVGYTVDEDGVASFTAMPAGLDCYDDAACAVSKASAVLYDYFYMTNNTKFVFVSKNAKTNSMVVTTATGYKNVNIAAGDEMMYVVYNEKDEVVEVFVCKAEAGAASAKTVAVLLNAEPVVTGTAAAPVYTYDVAVAGEATTLVSKGTALEDVDVGDVFSYVIDAKGAVGEVEVKVDFADAYAPVEYVGEDYFLIYNVEKQINVTEKLAFYCITVDETTGEVTVDVAEFADLVALDREAAECSIAAVIMNAAGTAATDVYFYVSDVNRIQ